MRWASSVDIATGWTVAIWFPTGTRHSSLLHSVHYGAHPALYLRGTRGSIHGGRSVRLTTHFYLVPRSRIVKLYLCFPIRLHGVVLNELSTGTLPYVVCMRKYCDPWRKHKKKNISHFWRIFTVSASPLPPRNAWTARWIYIRHSRISSSQVGAQWTWKMGLDTGPRTQNFDFLEAGCNDLG
jgi:hypothetical protein